jgi:hypothetical protein
MKAIIIIIVLLLSFQYIQKIKEDNKSRENYRKELIEREETFRKSKYFFNIMKGNKNYFPSIEKNNAAEYYYDINISSFINIYKGEETIGNYSANGRKRPILAVSIYGKFTDTSNCKKYYECDFRYNYIYSIWRDDDEYPNKNNSYIVYIGGDKIFFSKDDIKIEDNSKFELQAIIVPRYISKNELINLFKKCSETRDCDSEMKMIHYSFYSL